jgi:hypothetical protein
MRTRDPAQYRNAGPNIANRGFLLTMQGRSLATPPHRARKKRLTETPDALGMTP